MLPKSMSEKPKIPLTSRAGIIAKMGAAKHNQQVITKNKMDRTRDYVKQCLASSSQKSSVSVTSVRDDHKLPLNSQAENNNDDVTSRCSSVSTSVKLNFSKCGDNEDDRSSVVSASLKIDCTKKKG